MKDRTNESVVPVVDSRAEPLLSLPEAAKLFPPSRGGKTRCVASLTRYIMKGAGPARIRLEAVRISGQWATTAEAVHRFIERQTAVALGQMPAPSPTPSALRRNAEKADRQLAQMGF